MSQENVDVVVRSADALNRHDLDAWVACFHPAIEWEENSPAFVGLRPVYRGLVAIREWFQEALLDHWDGFHFVLEEATELADGLVMVVGIIKGRGKGSGVETQQRVWQLCWVTDGMIRKRQLYLEREAALEAVGRSE